MKAPFRPRPVVKHVVFKENVTSQDLEQIQDNIRGNLDNFVHDSTWSVNGIGRYDLSENDYIKILPKVHSTSCSYLSLNIYSPQIPYLLAPITFNSLLQIFLSGELFNSNITSLQIFAFFNTETIKHLHIEGGRFNKLNFLNKINWPSLYEVQIKSNKMVSFGQCLNRTKMNSSNFFLSFQDFHQDDFSCMAKLRMASFVQQEKQVSLERQNKQFSVILSNQMRGFCERIEMIPQQTLVKCLNKKLNNKNGLGIHVWDRG